MSAPRSRPRTSGSFVRRGCAHHHVPVDEGHLVGTRLDAQLRQAERQPRRVRFVVDVALGQGIFRRILIGHAQEGHAPDEHLVAVHAQAHVELADGVFVPSRVGELALFAGVELTPAAGRRRARRQRDGTRAHEAALGRAESDFEARPLLGEHVQVDGSGASADPVDVEVELGFGDAERSERDAVRLL